MLEATLFLLLLGLAMAIILAIASRVFYVWEDPRVIEGFVERHTADLLSVVAHLMCSQNPSSFLGPHVRPRLMSCFMRTRMSSMTAIAPSPV